MYRFVQSPILAVLLTVAVVFGMLPPAARAQMPGFYSAPVPNSKVLPDYVASGGADTLRTQSAGQELVPEGYVDYAAAPASLSISPAAFHSSLTQGAFETTSHYDDVSCSTSIWEDATTARFQLDPATQILYMPSDEFINTDSGLQLARYPTCEPKTEPTITSANTTFFNPGSYPVRQTTDVNPLYTMGERKITYDVESVPRSTEYSDHVKVTITTGNFNEQYLARFWRGGDDTNLLPAPGDWTTSYPTNSVYRNGQTYFIDWKTDWYGMPARDEEWFELNSGIQKPQILQASASYPTVSDSVVRPRNSDVLFITKPECKTGSSDGFWKSKAWVDCVTYGISADGRLGTARYHNEQSSSGWGIELGMLAAAFAVGYAFPALEAVPQFVEFPTLTSATIADTLVVVDNAITFAVDAFGVSANVGAGAVSSQFLLTTAALEAISGPSSSLGTVENSDSLGVGHWTWTEPWRPGGGESDKTTCRDTNATNYGGSLPCTYRPATGITASLTVNGTDSATVKPGEALDYAWDSSGANTFSSSYTSNCGKGAWVANTAKGSESARASGSQVGCTYTITYAVQDAYWDDENSVWEINGGASDSVTVAVVDANACTDPLANNFGGTIPCTYDSDKGGNPPPGGPGGPGPGGGNPPCTATAGNFCSGGDLYRRAADCKEALLQACAWGCTGSSCDSIPPPTVNKHLKAIPSLLRRGETTKVSWDVSNVRSCTVSGEDNKTWTKKASQEGGETSDPINAQTVFTLNCAALPGATPPSISESVTVNIIPSFEER